MRNENTPPYVVSSDLNLLMNRWAEKSKYIIPKPDYFRGMLRDLESVLNGYFPNVECLPEELISYGINSLVRESKLPVVSLDRAYVEDDNPNVIGYLDLCRAVDVDLNNTGELCSRPGYPEKLIQLSKVSESVLRVGSRVVLVDDVLFEGETHTQIFNWLKEKGVVVDTVIVAIAIRSGVEKLNCAGVKVKSLLEYDDVVDEVCERDFVAGVPLSGRTVQVNGSGEFGAPYFKPFGKPEKWATIPLEKVDEFSAFCLIQSIGLWSLIERLSGDTIHTENVPKPVFGLDGNSSITSALKKYHSVQNEK